MRKLTKLTLCCAALVASFTSTGLVQATDQQEWTPNGNGGNSCPCCKQLNCGCSSSGTQILGFECTCSPIQCTRSCDYGL